MMNMMRMKTKTRQSLSLFLLSLPLFFLLFVWLWRAFSFSVFFLGFSPSTLKSLAFCVLLLFVGQIMKRRKKRGKRVFSSLPTNSLSFSLFCCCSLFFLFFDETKRRETDLMSAQKKNIAKKRERKAEEGQKTPKRQNEKTRASRRESVAFLGRKGESNVLSLRLFFESWRYVILLPRFYTLARGIEPLFAAQEEKAEEFLRAA